MRIFFRFISGIYLKNFFIIFFSLLGFYCGVDLLLNFKDLPKAANLDLLYVMFLSFSAVPYVLPISLVFALVVCLVSMIRSNEFVSLHALGFSKNYIILFPFLWALFFCCVYIGLNFTSFAYANDYKRNILKNGTIMNQSGEVFLKLNNNFVYIWKINNGQNSAQNIKIFHLNDLNLSSFISAKNAHFESQSWVLKDGNITLLPKNYRLGNEGLKIKEFSQIRSLDGFKPKIIEGVASNSDYSISDALESFELFRAQNVNIDAPKISLYKFLFTPFFAPFLMLIMYYFFPVIARFFNLAFVTFVAFVVTLMIWGVLFLLTRLSENDVIISEIGIILPIVFLGFLSAYMYYKHR
ncbi:LptF/LptG family permease [Campylobacter sp. VicNov18]|uniref:LptF/LptG family permease n=1 Tax=Campylobacter bilis TaxID=2691918 RepID=UPI00130E65DA|nr:LptF/LptG family permease [Campylobacter bilis]MPV63264.1 LptF/LptG family permease [Campylobacter hepaticus]MBM0636763.1 LptF/LptG family permease [Campylobacter bilis]MCC8277335.1 LptF/LptG family permease [Campylobacter bilis]MCC8299078.1 LptF/LptG family permease [Campylobacter bilis]MCC8300244.1 LptF/LptG family permease [Campylobacter bilis]